MSARLHGPVSDRGAKSLTAIHLWRTGDCIGEYVFLVSENCLERGRGVRRGRGRRDNTTSSRTTGRFLHRPIQYPVVPSIPRYHSGPSWLTTSMTRMGNLKYRSHDRMSTCHRFSDPFKQKGFTTNRPN